MEIFVALLILFGGGLLLREWWKHNERRASTEAEQSLLDVFEKQGIATDDEEAAEARKRGASPREATTQLIGNLAATLRGQSLLADGKGGLLSNIDRSLTLAGRPRNWSASEALAATLLTWAGMTVVIGFLTFTLGFPRELAALVLICIFLYPPLSLRNARIRRQDAARFELLDFINDLRQNVSGNSPLPDAIERMVRETPPGEKQRVLVQEFNQAYREYRVGNRSFEDALIAAGQRIGVHAVNDFVDAIVQSRRTGAPIGEVLESQYNQAIVLYDEDLQTMIAKKVVPMTVSLAIVMTGALVWLVGPMVLDALQGLQG